MAKDKNAEILAWALSQAVGRDDENEVRRLVAKGADVNFVPDTTLLMRCAATTFNLELFKAMVTDIRSLSTTDSRGWNAMMYALDAGNLGIVRYCVQQGIPVNYSQDVEQPLIIAIQAGRIGIVKFLLKAGAEVNATDSLGRTPLMYALAKGNTEVAMMLVSHGADLMQKDTRKKTILTYSLESNDLSAVKYAVELMRLSLPKTILVDAVSLHVDLDIIKYLVGQGAAVSLESTEVPRGILLDLAVQSGRDDLVRYLLRQGASMSENILEIAARRGNPDSIRIIQKYDPPQGDRGRFIEAVVQSGNLKLLSSVMEEIRVMDRDAQHRLMFIAVHSGFPALFEQLRDDLDLDVDYLDDQGSSLLFEAVYLGFPPQVKQVDCVTKDDLYGVRRTVSDRIGRYEILRNLVEKEHIPVNLTNAKGESAIQIAARYLNFPAIQYLQKQGGGLYGKDEKGESAEEILLKSGIGKLDQRKLEKAMEEGTCLGRRASIRHRL